MKRSYAVLVFFALAACSGGGTLPPPAPGAVAASQHRAPADSVTGMPGDSVTGLPGDSVTGMPGGRYACAPLAPSGSANCTLAVSVAAPPLADPATPGALIPGLHPTDLQSAYALPASSAGGTVAVVDAFDDPAAEADLAVYRAAFGLPPCTTANGCFRKLYGGSGAPPGPNAGWAQEIALDLDVVSAACPRCRIVLVEAQSALLDDLGAGVDAAAALHPAAISNSYYATEWPGELAEDVHYRHPGIAVTASSGDHPQTAYPAASANVTAVGGTTLARSGSGWSETAWAFGGRGCSAYVATPAWQGGTPCATRAAVDLAVVADPRTGVAFFEAQAGGWLVGGGTSVGAPLVAAAYALSGTPADPSFAYAHRSAFRPLAGASAFDLATGLGAPDGVAGL